MAATILSVFFSVCVAEMGDKTQLLVMGFAAKYRMRAIIFGVSGAIVLLNALGVLLGGAVAKLVPMQYVSLAAGFFFLIFAYLSIGADEGAERAKVRRSSALGIGCAFFMAELGDKTQLSTVAFSANAPEQLFAVFLGATLGMLAADGIGLCAAKLLGKRLPERALSAAAYCVFTAFGLHTLWQCCGSFLPRGGLSAWIVVAAVYFALCALALRRARKYPAKKQASD